MSPTLFIAAPVADAKATAPPVPGRPPLKTAQSCQQLTGIKQPRDSP